MVLPLRAILFQVLFLMVAIATEAVVLRWRLGLQRRVSMQYAVSLNLFSTLIGWLIFFAIAGWLPNLFSGVLEQQLISYILFDQFFLSDWKQSMNTLLVISAVLTFFGTFLVEINGLILLEIILGVYKFEQKQDTLPDGDRLSRYRDSQTAISLLSSNKAYAILIANAFSYSAILLILIIRYLSVTP
jgi:hypothetical protein